MGKILKERGVESHGRRADRRRAGGVSISPLLIKQLLHAPMVQAPKINRSSIAIWGSSPTPELRERDRPARKSGLKMLGVRPGDTAVRVMDWDSNRFLEAFFAIPMMGAVLQTVNVRLSPEQITYTINHAGASVLLVNDEFVRAS